MVAQKIVSYLTFLLEKGHQFNSLCQFIVCSFKCQDWVFFIIHSLNPLVCSQLSYKIFKPNFVEILRCSFVTQLAWMKNSTTIAYVQNFVNFKNIF